MLGTSDGAFCPLSKLWCKSPQTEFFGLERERFFVQSRAKDAHASGLPDEWAGLLSSEINCHGCAELMGLGEGNTH